MVYGSWFLQRDELGCMYVDFFFASHTRNPNEPTSNRGLRTIGIPNFSPGPCNYSIATEVIKLERLKRTDNTFYM